MSSTAPTTLSAHQLELSPDVERGSVRLGAAATGITKPDFMRLHEQTEAGVDIIRVEGDVDLHFAPVLRQILQGKAKHGCPALLLDLTAVDFIGSSGIAAVLEYLRDATDSGALFCIGGISARLRPIVEIVRLDRSMPVFADVARAREAMIARQLPPVSQPVFARTATTLAGIAEKGR